MMFARGLFLPNLEECYRIIRRWPDEATCPGYGSKNIQKNRHAPKGAQKYHCRNCDLVFENLKDFSRKRWLGSLIV